MMSIMTGSNQPSTAAPSRTCPRLTLPFHVAPPWTN
jgi:hypothetical protein